VNITLLVATLAPVWQRNSQPRGFSYGMGRGQRIPKSFFGVVKGKHGIPRNSVLFVGSLALIGAFLLTYQLGAEL